MQTRVRQRFSQLQAQDDREGKVPWYVVNAAQTIDEVQAEINAIVERTVKQVETEQKPLELLWHTAENQVDKEN